MPFYLRKSVRLGPIRFNLSKSGIGLSGGVKGFRVGIRPNGRSYVHAGRYGLYYRKELGGGRKHTDSSSPISPTQETECADTAYPDTVKYDSATSKELAPQSRKELIDKLNNSYKSFRLDYLTGCIFIILTLFVFNKNPSAVFFVALTGIAITVAVAIWETKRRTVTITYEFEDGKAAHFKQLISAFNNLASNQHVWALIDSRSVADTHEAKLNAGAGNLVNRSDAQVGEGKPPWVYTNIDVPVLKARNLTLYMMPDGIFVYDDKGVGFVEYKDISVSENTTRFIEEKPPSDSKIVDRTWKHPNKNGGPDRRFKDNYEIPICLYGELKIQSKSGLFLYLMTSKHDSPAKFHKGFNDILSV